MPVPWPIIPDEPSNSRSNWEHGNSTAVISYRVPWDEESHARRLFLGYSARDGLSIHRELPQQHPRYHWLYASRLEIHGENLVGRTEASHGPLDKYEHLQFQVVYQTRPYSVVADGGNEWDRWTRWAPQPSAEFFVHERNKVFSFDVQDGAPDARRVNVGLPMRIPTMDQFVTWYEVPEEYLMPTRNPGLDAATTAVANDYNAGGMYPAPWLPYRLMRCLNRVNHETWFNYQPRTLLLKSVRLKEAYSATLPKDLEIKGLGKPSRLWDVEMQFSWRPMGWHRYPHPENLKFFRVVADAGVLGGAVGQRGELYPTGRFDRIFDAWDAHGFGPEF